MSGEQRSSCCHRVDSLRGGCYRRFRVIIPHPQEPMDDANRRPTAVRYRTGPPGEI